jgi:outer membrane protein
MLKKAIITTMAAAICVAMTGTGFAQSKIGTVDMNKIFSSYYKTKDAESRINEARAAAKKELDDRMDTHKTTLEEIKKLDEALAKPELSKEAKETKAKERDTKLGEFRNLEREINEFRQTREKQLQEQAVRMRNGIVEEITKIVAEKVKKENYDLVLDRSGNSLNGVPIAVYANDALDFSESIITELNKNKSAGGDAAAASPSSKGDSKKD